LTEENEVMVTFSAQTTKDTLVNLTQHSYFNLTGQKESVLEQEVQIFAKEQLEIERERKQLERENLRKQLELEKEQERKRLVEEYNEPFLIDGHLMTLRCYLMLYVSGNGVIKCFCLDTKKPLIDKEKYYIDEKNVFLPIKISPIYNNWPNDFKSGELAHIANNDAIIDNFIKTFMDILLMYDGIKPYSEANSGFLTIEINLKFIKNFLEMDKFDKSNFPLTPKHSTLLEKGLTPKHSILSEKGRYMPILQDIRNWTKLENNNITNDQFIKDYYLWIKNSVIYPHFGLSPSIEPIAIKVSDSKLDASIIKKLSVHFEKNRELAIISLIWF
jgi:hypothetical protein